MVLLPRRCERQCGRATMLKELAAAAASRLRAPKLRALRAFHVQCSSLTSAGVALCANGRHPLLLRGLPATKALPGVPRKAPLCLLCCRRRGGAPKPWRLPPPSFGLCGWPPLRRRRRHPGSCLSLPQQEGGTPAVWLASSTLRPVRFSSSPSPPRKLLAVTAAGRGHPGRVVRLLHAAAGQLLIVVVGFPNIKGIEALCAAPPEAPSLQVGSVAVEGVGHLRIVRHLRV